MSLAHETTSTEELRPPLHLVEETELPRPEYQHGLERSDWEIYKVPLAAINTFLQQREGANERQVALTDSINSKVGMINPVNFTLVPQETLEEYMEFTNRVWGDVKTINDFTPLERGDNPHYVVLIAGHSRVRAHRKIAAQGDIDPGIYTIDARLHKVESVDEIVAIQLAENIHSDPPPDRAARAYAESFLWMKAKDPALTQKAFMEKHRVTKQALSDALFYVELPPPIRALTDNGGLPFKVAVELGRALEPIRKEAALTVSSEFGEDWTEESRVQYKDLVFNELLRFIVQFNKDGHRTNARARIQQHAKALRDKHADDDKRAVEELVLFGGVSYQERCMYLRKEIERNLRVVKEERAVRARTLHQMAVELFGEPELDFDAELEQSAVLVGNAALAGARG